MKQELNVNELEQVTGGAGNGNKQVFKCKYCGKEFYTEKECQEHEKECDKKPHTSAHARRFI